MRDVRIKKYLKKMSYTYALGFHCVLDLVRAKPSRVVKVLFKNEANRFKETKQIRFLCQQNKIRYEFNNKLVDKIAAKKNTYAAAVFEKYEDELDPTANHIVLVNPSDFGNVGAVVRSMAAFGFRDLALIRPAADIFDPKVISTTTGALFKIKVKHFDTFQDYVDQFEFHHCFLFKLDGDKKLKGTKFNPLYTLVFGHETRGLDSEYDKFGTTIKIRQSEETDSLNLAVSASIAMYKASS